MTTAAGLPGIAALALGITLFWAALIAARWRREPEAGGRRNRASLAGIVVQGLAFVIAASGPVRVTLDPLGTAALVQAGVVALLMATTLTLFVWAAATMGRNWSLVARTRADHALVTAGPFAWVRHPIYTALALMLVAVAVALGHGPRLVVAVPVYAVGTWLRVRIEERLLRVMFGGAYDAYAARVKRFVPGLF
ncbi:isoprenylcysteine carboxylmethyltransferase family protein [Sphingomonas sp. RP10(2022)]|uniref:Isoprenylcysteine carboxylmethyltransferase family protein n=1 Tax=Sphingomonas liriopis TaxID=2949094 RepID=A0A9X2KQ19_9SPHN|nr:isoprenylcysteine carboxylmethyltransferase family protein [Sphingomonas liriopis]MCP3734502.1 isoprenylcysteine carboxylmethyltransferase family protein [Sphingomonas liriopis]